MAISSAGHQAEKKTGATGYIVFLATIVAISGTSAFTIGAVTLDGNNTLTVNDTSPKTSESVTQFEAVSVNRYIRTVSVGHGQVA